MNIFDLDLEQEFLEAFTVGGSPVSQCQCGREYVCVDNTYYFDGLGAHSSDYIDCAKEDSNIKIMHDIDGVTILDVLGRHFIAECECRGWVPYMELLIANHREISMFVTSTDKKLELALEYEKTFKRLLKD